MSYKDKLHSQVTAMSLHGPFFFAKIVKNYGAFSLTELSFIFE